MPLGPKVFVRAQLCNTNEVFIRYNEVFTKQSAYDAQAACKRQLNSMFYLYTKKKILFKFIILLGCDNMLENLRKEKELFMDNISARQEIVNVSEQLVEINEPYDEAEEAAWNGKVLSDKNKIVVSVLNICIYLYTRNT